jgi:hypothetical protein
MPQERRERPGDGCMIARHSGVLLALTAGANFFAALISGLLAYRAILP